VDVDECLSEFREEIAEHRISRPRGPYAANSTTDTTDKTPNKRQLSSSEQKSPPTKRTKINNANFTPKDGLTAQYVSIAFCVTDRSSLDECRAVFGRDWKSSHPLGTVSEFQEAWKNVTSDTFRKLVCQGDITSLVLLADDFDHQKLNRKVKALKVPYLHRSLSMAILTLCVRKRKRAMLETLHVFILARTWNSEFNCTCICTTSVFEMQYLSRSQSWQVLQLIRNWVNPSL